MKRVQLSGGALLLAVTASAWAGGGLYPADTGDMHASSKTRAQVVAEIHEAQRLGLIDSVDGDFFPNVEVSVDPGDARELRAKIHAETLEAGRLGLLSVGEGDPPVATAAQEALIAAAGQQASSRARVARQEAIAQPGNAVDAWTESR